MANLIDYTNNYASISFTEEPLNELDFALFADLAYLPFNNYVSNQSTINYKTLKQIAGELLKDYAHNNYFNPVLLTPHRKQLLEIIKSSQRYGEIQAMGFQDILSDKSHFSAVTFVTQQEAIITFRGTTDTIAGWRENFNLSYGAHNDSQQFAHYYLLNMLTSLKNYNIFITGHSKGANIAMYAAQQLKQEDLLRIKALYLFDGPGFSQLKHKGKIPLNKINHYIPEHSIIGLLMEHEAKPKIVASNVLGLFQHLHFLWDIEDNHFIYRSQVSNISKLISITIKEWMTHNQAAELETYFTLIFNLLEQTNFQSILEINNHPLKFTISFLDRFYKLSSTDQHFIRSHTTTLYAIARAHYKDIPVDFEKDYPNLIKMFRSISLIVRKSISLPPLSTIVQKMIQDEDK